MSYITTDDLLVYIQEPLMIASLAAEDGTLDNDILDSIISPVIDLVKSYVGTRYDTALIFAGTPIRNGVLVQIISMITTYRIVRRNAARKVPEDYNNMYSDALKLLEKVQSGSQYLDNLPLVKDESGNIPLMYGNTTNKDYFI